MLSDSFPYFPGVKVDRQFSGYTPWQQALWLAWDDSYYANLGGYVECRMPTPGKPVDMTAFGEWQEKVEQAWAVEATRDAWTRGLTIDELPESLWLSLYERMVAADKYRGYLNTVPDDWKPEYP